MRKFFKKFFPPGIKDLDGERKALVYDNYSKLIAAADTIGKVCMHNSVGLALTGYG